MGLTPHAFARDVLITIGIRSGTNKTFNIENVARHHRGTVFLVEVFCLQITEGDRERSGKRVFRGRFTKISVI
jgi:hypothetical protein